MKKFVLEIFVFFTIISLSSCEPWEDDSYEDESNPTEEVEIPGTWKLTLIQLENAYDFNGDGTASSNLMSETNCYQNELINFNMDFTGVATSNSYALITIENETFTVECIQEVEDMALVWAKTGNTVTLTSDGQTFNATLEGNTLTYIVPEGFVVLDTDVGTITLQQDMIFRYTKQ